MKFSTALIAAGILLFSSASIQPAAAADQGTQAKSPEAAYECKENKAKGPTCRRHVSERARKECRWRCTIGHCRPDGSCIEVCRGSGQECNGKEPGKQLPM